MYGGPCGIYFHEGEILLELPRIYPMKDISCWVLSEMSFIMGMKDISVLGEEVNAQERKGSSFIMGMKDISC